MEYTKLRNKVKKFYGGGSLDFTEIQRQVQGLGFSSLSSQQKQIYLQGIETESGQEELNEWNTPSEDIMNQASQFNAQFNQEVSNIDNSRKETERNSSISQIMSSPEVATELKTQEKQNNMSNLAGALGVNQNFIGDGAGQMSAGGAMAMGMIGNVGVGAMKAIDDLAMGDKNFGTQSQAVDAAVHGVSGALMSSGNPYAMAAGAALEGANFLTKAGGQTVQGFDVNIENSGFGTMNHMESSSSRDWGTAIGLGGIFTRSMEKKLAKRNEQARMAMQAAEISEDIKFEQEARMNSVDNVLRNNQIALAGGINTSLLGN